MNKRDDNSSDDNNLLTKRASELFDESVQGLDAQTRSRLNRGRQAALAELNNSRSFQALSPWVPAVGVAAVAVFAVALWNGQAPLEEITPMAEGSDFEILLDDDSFEMLQELEFYSWIDMEAEVELSEESNVG